MPQPMYMIRVEKGPDAGLVAAVPPGGASLGRSSQNDLVFHDETLSRHLATSGMPDPDLLIRTGGDLRVSNYLLWQIAYSELYFTSKYDLYTDQSVSPANPRILYNRNAVFYYIKRLCIMSKNTYTAILPHFYSFLNDKSVFL